MTYTKLLQQYLDKKIDAISLIRQITDKYDPENKGEVLLLIWMIARHEQNDMTTDIFKKIWVENKETSNSKKLFNKGDYPQQYDAMSYEQLQQELVTLKMEYKDIPTTFGGSLAQIAFSYDITLLGLYLLYRFPKENNES